MRILRKIWIFCAGLLTVFGFAGCETEKTDCVYKIVPVLQAEKGGPLSPIFENIVVYGFIVEQADTALWEVRSYQDARQGILSARDGDQTVPPAFRAEINADMSGLIEKIRNGIPIENPENIFLEYADLQFGPMQRETGLMIAACDMNDHGYGSKIYAWRAAQVVADLPSVVIQWKICPWEERDRYIDAQWIIMNDNPYVPPVVEPEPEPEPEPENPGEEEDDNGEDPQEKNQDNPDDPSGYGNR